MYQVNEYKIKYQPGDPGGKITESREIYELIKPIFKDNMNYREMFITVMLNRANQVTGYHLTSLGGVSGTVVDAKIVFHSAVSALASSIILAHNHPSGNLTPSQADIDLTHKLISAGKFLDIHVLDHLILGRSGYVSFGDEGLI